MKAVKSGHWSRKQSRDWKLSMQTVMGADTDHAHGQGIVNRSFEAWREWKLIISMATGSEIAWVSHSSKTYIKHLNSKTFRKKGNISQSKSYSQVIVSMISSWLWLLYISLKRLWMSVAGLRPGSSRRLQVRTRMELPGLDGPKLPGPPGIRDNHRRIHSDIWCYIR